MNHRRKWGSIVWLAISIIHLTYQYSNVMQKQYTNQISPNLLMRLSTIL